MTKEFESNEEMRIARKKDVWHLVTRGRITRLVFDFESYGLNTDFSQIMGGGFVTADLGWNVLEEDRVRVKPTDRSLPTLPALTVTRQSFEDLQNDPDALPHPVAMAKMAKIFEDAALKAASNGHLVTEQEYTEFRKRGETLYPYKKTEDIVHIPLFEEGGEMEVGADGYLVTDPPQALRLNEDGHVVFAATNKLITIPHVKNIEQPDGSVKETLVHRPMKPTDGRITFDVRVHKDRNYIAWKVDLDPHSPYYENVENQFYTDQADFGESFTPAQITQTRWKLVPPSNANYGYNNKSYDNPLWRGNLARGGFHASNMFFPYSKSTISHRELPKNLSVDGLHVIKQAYAFGPQGEEGLKIGTRTDPQTGETVYSFKLDLVMQANTRFENKGRNVREGVFMPDGSHYDGDKGHDEVYDTLATIAALRYASEVDPESLKRMELQSDEDYLKGQLFSNKLDEGHYPVYAVMRNHYRNRPLAEAVAFLGFDDRQGQLRRTVSVRITDFDLRKYKYMGKTLLEMAREDMAQPDPARRHFVRMMKEQERRPDALIRIDSVRKFAGMTPLPDALHSHSSEDWDLEAIDNNFRYLMLENPEIGRAIMAALEEMNWEMRQDKTPANAMMEEEALYNGFGDLVFMEGQSADEAIKKKRFPSRDQTSGIEQMLFEKASEIFKYHNAIDEMLHRLAIQPMPIDVVPFDESINEDEAIASYTVLFQKIYKRLRKKDSPYVHLFDEFLNNKARTLNPPRTVEDILAFRERLKLQFLSDSTRERNDKRSAFANGIFDHKYSKKGRLLLANMSREYRVVDERGRILDKEYLEQEYCHRPQILQQKLDSGDWRIQFYRLRSEPSETAILMQFADMKRLKALPKIWQFRYQALRLLYLNGPPNEDASNMRWDAIPVLERQLLAVEINKPIHDDGELARVFSEHVSGDADVFLRTDEGQRWVADYRKMLESAKKSAKQSEAALKAMHFDTKTGLPLDYIRFEIPAEKDSHIVIDVPDAHLEDPLRDVRQSPYSLVIKSLKETDRKRIRSGLPVVLRGMQSGALYYAGGVNITKAPVDSPSYSDYFEQAQRTYEDDAGVKFPTPAKRDVIRIEGLMPLAATRQVNAGDQTLKVPQDYFKALVNPRAAHFHDDEPMSGLVMPADYCPQTLKNGQDIRFREMYAAMGAKMTGEEGGETGHTYTTKLETHEIITVGDLYTRITDGTLNDDQARRYGYAGAYDMWEKVNAAFLNRNAADADSEKILMVTFEPVDKASWAFFDPPSRPEASFIYDGQPASPSAYRSVVPREQGANDNAPEKTSKKQSKSGPQPS